MINNKKLLLCMTGTVLALASSWSFATSTSNNCSSITIKNNTQQTLQYTAAGNCGNSSNNGKITSNTATVVETKGMLQLWVSGTNEKFRVMPIRTETITCTEDNGTTTCNTSGDVSPQDN